jgi:PAS domain S-box-containing protein
VRKIAFGAGAHASGAAFEQARVAARAALEQVRQLPPALVLVFGRGPGSDAGELMRGVRDVLGDCPSAGVLCPPHSDACGAVPDAGVRVFLLASAHLRAKVGVGVGDPTRGGVEQPASEAFRDSFIPTATPVTAEDASERNLYHWYLYRRPSLALAAVVSRDGSHRSQGPQVAAFLRRRLHGRVPLLLFSPHVGEAAVFADGRVVTSGVVLVMVKTDLKFSLQRFHSFEPVGAKLFVTRAEGNRIFECNHLPAMSAYWQALGIEPGDQARVGDGQRPFSVFPLAHRSRDGRFHLLQPECGGPDGSLSFPAAVETDRVLYPMKAVPSSDLWRPSPRDTSLIPDPRKLAAALVIRDTGLRDLPWTLSAPADAAPAVQPVEIPCGRELTAHLSPEDDEYESGHLLLAFERELDPVAVAAADNERLLTQVVQLKDLHQKIFDSIGYGIAVVDTARRVQFCNNTHRELLGDSPAALEGRACPWSCGDAAVCGDCACEEAIARKEPVNREVVREVDGKARWYRLDTFPLRDAAGGVTAAIEVMRDVTAFKDLRFSLESEQRKMEAVIRGMGETLYIVNARYDLLFFHRGVLPLAAAEEGQGGRRRCHEALFRRSLPCPWCRMHETMRSGGVERRVAQVADEAGEERAYQVTFSPWGVGGSDQAAVVCLLVDISAQKRLEQQMVLSEKLNSLSILSAGMAHELNNPLGAINFNLEILKRREQSTEYQEVLESIRKDVLRINRIVGNLLSFSRSGAASSGWVAIPEIADNALELFQVVIERRRIEVRRAYAAGLPAVWGNAQDLQQVFINFIANAVDAMPTGGAIDIAIACDAGPAAGRQPAGVAVVYDSAGDLHFLRTLTNVPDCQVRFFRGDEEAIDAFRVGGSAAPEVLLLSFADTDPDRVAFFVMMVKEFAPEARVLVIADADKDERWARVPGIAGVLPRPLDTARVVERVRAAVEGLRSQQQGRADVVVRFADTGVGIQPEIAERIFDPFFTTKDTKGTGLGLSVVHKILENHGATVRVGGAPGQGTVFTVTFPQGQEVGPEGPFRMRPEHGFRSVS